VFGDEADVGAGDEEEDVMAAVLVAGYHLRHAMAHRPASTELRHRAPNQIPNSKPFSDQS